MAETEEKKIIYETSAYGFERIVTFTAAWDKTTEDPRTNRGISGVDMHMILRGPLGAVQFLLYTNWFLPDQFALSPFTPRIKPVAAGITYHSRIRRSESDKIVENCEILHGECYSSDEGSLIYSDTFFDALRTGGSEAVWEKLAGHYDSVFHPEEGEKSQ